jgi:hypothetical protein
MNAAAAAACMSLIIEVREEKLIIWFIGLSGLVM